MINRVLIAMSLLTVCLWPCHAGAVGKITEDPNAPGAKPPAAVEEESGDKRLAQKVTYEAKRKSVLAILNDLAKLTGIAYKVGTNNQDWQVRDRRMNVFAKDVPLARLMSSIARVMKFKWSKSDDKEAPTYRLFMDRRAVLEEESKRIQEEQRYEKRQTERRQKALDSFARSASMSPDELAKLKTENPFLYICTESGLTGSVVGLFRESPAIADALSTGRRLTVSSGNLSPAAQQAILGVVNGMAGLEKRFGGNERPLPGGMADNPGRISLDINSHMDEARHSPGAGLMVGMIMMSYSGPGDENYNTGFPIIDPDSALSKVLGKALLRAEQEGKPMNDIGKEFEAELTKALVDDMKKDLPDEPKADQPPDPDLEKKIKLDKPGQQLDEVLGALAKAGDIAVASDSFGKSHGLPGLMVNEGDLKTVLDKIGDAYLCGWEKHGPVVEFRDREWFQKRAQQLPEAWLEDWRSKLKKNGTLDLPDLARMGALTLEQFQMNIMSDDVLNVCISPVMQNRELLKLYSVLGDAQRQMAFTEAGLDLHSVGPDQWPAVEKAIGPRNASMLDNPDAPLVFYCQVQPLKDDKRAHYSFRIEQSLPERREVTWDVVTPQYTAKPEKTGPPPSDKKPEPPSADGKTDRPPADKSKQ